MAEEQAPDFSGFASKYSRAAREARRRLPTELLPALHEIEDSLLENPDRFPQRLIPISRDGKTLLYTHPEPPIEVTFEVDREHEILYFLHFSAPTLEVGAPIFISYSHEDEGWLVDLKKYLGGLEEAGRIRFWDDSRIEAGTDWNKTILEALQTAKAAVLLVSQDFLTSKFVSQVELPRILAAASDEGKRVFWIPVSPSTVFETHPEIARFQSPLKNPQVSLEELEVPQRKRALVQISNSIAEAIT